MYRTLLLGPGFALDGNRPAETRRTNGYNRLASAGMGGQLVQLLLGLLLVIGLIFLLAWLMRRVQQIVPRGGQGD